MIIMASTLAAAINEIRHITPKELTRDNIKVVDSEKTENENRKEGENNV